MNLFFYIIFYNFLYIFIGGTLRQKFAKGAICSKSVHTNMDFGGLSGFKVTRSFERQDVGTEVL